MTDADYRAALTAAIKEYEDLGLQRRHLDDRMRRSVSVIPRPGRFNTCAPPPPEHPPGSLKCDG